MQNCEILPFNREHLITALTFVNDKGQPLHPDYSIADSPHFDYLFSYLYKDNGDDLNCQTIVVEDKYFSESYFTDYISYYINCYAAVSKTCRRVHFFSKDFEENEFLEAVFNHTHPAWDSYLGYIVVKPIPRGTIGATLLKHYHKRRANQQTGRRCFFAVKDYHANLFGKHLTISSMIYQEQDGIVGACATAALWFALHQLNRVFNIPVLTPAQITLAAGYRRDTMEPMIPSRGLTIEQVLKATYSFGLTADAFSLDEIKPGNQDNQQLYQDEMLAIRLFVNAYMHLKIPLLLGLKLLGLEPYEDAYHLVTIAGCRFDDEVLPNDTAYLAASMDRFFAHDDQVGPFSKIKLLDWDVAEETTGHFLTSWKKEILQGDTDENKLKARGEVIVAPLSNSIKLSFKEVYQEAGYLHYLLEEWKDTVPGTVANTCCLDFFIIESNRYKNYILEHNYELEAERENILFHSLPRYIWVIQGLNRLSRRLLFDVLYDPYNVNMENARLTAHVYNHAFCDALLVLPEANPFKKYFAAAIAVER